MSKRREQEQVHEKDSFGRLVGKIYASLYNNVPWLAVAAICLYLPGIVLWAVFALRCKADTFTFLTTIAPVADETVDGVSNLVNTTLIALITTATFIFMLALVLAIARSVQKAGTAPLSAVPCARPTPSSYYLYRVFNLGYNFIVFFVNMFIVFLMMGAFLWLVVAYGANLSIKGGVLGSASDGFRPQVQYDLARQNYTTVVSYYEQQLKLTPPCVRNTTWFRNINSSIASILKPAADDSPGNTVLCPQSCLNLGSWATLFKLQSNCMCEQEKLYLLQQYSLAVATDAGVALGGLILIYFGSCCMHAYLISEHTHAGYDYKRAKRHASRRLAGANNSSDNHRQGGDKGSGGGGGSGNGGGSAGGGGVHEGPKDGPDGGGTTHHIISINGAAVPDANGSSQLQYGSHGQQNHHHQRHGSGSSVHESGSKGASESRGGSFSVVEEGRQLQTAPGPGGASLPLVGTSFTAGAAGALAAAAAAATAGHAAAQGYANGAPGAAFAADLSPFAMGLSASAAGTHSHEGSVVALQHPQQRLHVHQHHRISSGGGSSSSPASLASRHLQRIPSPPISGRTATAAAAARAGGVLVHHNSLGAAPCPGDGSWHAVGSTGGHRASSSTGSRVGDWQQQQLLAQQQQQQQQHMGHGTLRATSPPTVAGASMWSSHGRSESRSSTSSIRDLLSGAVPLDSYGCQHHHRPGLTPTNSGHVGPAAAAVAAAAAATAVGIAVAAAGPEPSVLRAGHPTAAVAVAGVPPSATASPGTLPAERYAAAAAADGGGSSSSAAMHRRADSQQSDSTSSSSYDTVVCHSPRDSEPDNTSVVSQAVIRRVAAAGVPAGAAFLSMNGTAQGVRQQPQGTGTPSTAAAAAASAAAAAEQLAASEAEAAAAGVDGEVAVSPAAVMDGEELLSGSRTGSWRCKQAHRRHPALDFTTAAPALWLAQAGEQQQQGEQGSGDSQQAPLRQVTSAVSTPAAAAATGAAATAGAAAGAAAAAACSSQSFAAVGSRSSIADRDLVAAAHQQQQQQQHSASVVKPATAAQQQQQVCSITTASARLTPSPDLTADQQEQQQLGRQEESLGEATPDEADQQQQQQQRVRHRPPYSLLLPPPEQQELLLKQQQQQLQQLLRESQQEQQLQQQQVWGPQQRQWSAASSLSLAALGSSSGSSPVGHLLRQQQQHHHSYSTPDVGGTGAAAFVGGMTTPRGAVAGLHTPSTFMGGSSGVCITGGPYSAVSRAPSAAGFAVASGFTPLQQQQQQQQQAGSVHTGSFSSSSGGGVLFAGGASVMGGDEDSSPGDGGASFTSMNAPAAAAGYGLLGNAAGDSRASSLHATPQATPASSPAPLSRTGRVTPVYGGTDGRGSGSWSQLPPLAPGSGLTASSSYSGSANHPGFSSGLNSLLLAGSVGVPVPMTSPLGGADSAQVGGSGTGLGPRQSPGVGLRLLNPGVSGLASQGSGVPSIPPIPEVTSVEGSDHLVPGDVGMEVGGVAAAAAGGAGLQQPPSDVGVVSPLERRRSGYRSSMRKGLMAYDQYKHRQRYQETLTQPLDPGSEVARRYRSRMPAI